MAGGNSTRGDAQKGAGERGFCSVFVWVFGRARPIERGPVGQKAKGINA
jgi:hypothetical protein